MLLKVQKRNIQVILFTLYDDKWVLIISSL